MDLNDLEARVQATLATSHAPDDRLLGEILAGLPSVDGLLARARFDGARYVRVPLVQRPEWELRLLCWMPGQSSALHGHGASACAFRVLSGVATETQLDGRVEVLPAGAVRIAEAGGVHQVANLGDQPLVSLHLYAPPIPVDRPSAQDGRQIVVIGGGWSGVALTIHLLRSRDPGLRITLVEDGPGIGQGVAYGTDRAEHLLNVPAGAMSLDPSDPMDFEAFAWGEVEDAHAGSLLPRRLVAAYLLDRLTAAVGYSPARLRLARSRAVGLKRRGSRWAVRLADGRALRADDVVLATGLGPPVLPEAIAAFREHPGVIADVWAPGALDGIGAGDRVAVVGSGLTAVDVLLTLRARGVAGPVRVLCRGDWPRPHRASVRWDGPAPRLPDPPRTAEGLARWLAAAVQEGAAEGIPWQAVIDAVRIRVPALWAALSEAERETWLAGHRRDWERLRHRIPRETWDKLQSWREQGWWTEAVGALEVEADGDVVRVGVEGGPERFEVDRLLVCCGNLGDPRAFAGTLWSDLLARGDAGADPLGLGLQTDAAGAVVGRSRGLWTLGALRRPLSFESTAVPELAIQAAALARELTVGHASTTARREMSRAGDVRWRE